MSKKQNSSDNKTAKDLDLKVSKTNAKPVHEDLVFPVDDIDQDELLDDGHLVAKSYKVVKKGSKVNNEFSSTEINKEEFDSHKVDLVGKKDITDTARMGIDSLKKRFGFSWVKFGRKSAIFIALFGTIALIATSGVAAWAINIWNNTEPVDTQQAESSIIYARDGKTVLYKSFKDVKREVVPLVQDPNNPEANYIPIQMQLAMLALEDENFYYNDNGIPWSNLAGALATCITSVGDECRGASGISQQLRKNLTNEAQPTVTRKVEELFAALKLNQELNHTEILELYLNEVFFGRNSAGVQEAAKAYFGKDIKDVTVTESCYLAALVQSPSAYAASINNRESQTWEVYEGRKNACLDKLRTKQFKDDIDILIENDLDLEALKGEEVVFTPAGQEYPYPHFRDYVLQELRKFGLTEQALATQGYEIITTIDPTIQDQTQSVVDSNFDTLIAPSGADNAAAIILDGPSGEILSMVGSRDYYNQDIDGQVNILTSPQQPGSSIKPYVYASALARGFNPGTVLLDVRTDFGGGFNPKNYSNTTYGARTIRWSLQNSLNIPAVKAGYLSAGEGNTPDGARAVTNFFDFSESIGLRFSCIPAADTIDAEKNCSNDEYANSAYRNRCGVASFIGGCEINAVSHATGINTMAQNGKLVSATPFVSIKERRTGVDLYANIQASTNPVYPVKENAMDPRIARQMMNIMSDYDERDLFGSTRRNLQLDGWDGDNAVAAKTGTTDSVRDTWTVGATPYNTVVVWMGNTDNRPMNLDATSTTTALLWKQMLANVSEGKEKVGFSREGLNPIRLDRYSGLPSEGGNLEYLTDEQIQILNEAAGRVSKPEYSTRRNSIFQNRNAIIGGKIEVNKTDGLRATDLTLDKNKEEIECLDVASSFPLSANWYNPVVGYNFGFENVCPTKDSEQDQVADQGNSPDVTTSGIASNSVVSSTVRIVSTPTGAEGKEITGVEAFVDGQKVPELFGFGGDARFVTTPYVGTSDVLIRVIDNYGEVTELTFTNVQFGGSSGITITAPNGGAQIQQNKPNGLIVAGISDESVASVSIGSQSGTCTQNNQQFSCVFPPITQAKGPATITVTNSQGQSSTVNVTIV